MTDLVPVKLLKHHDRYNAGEVAGFPKATAIHLIAQGVAKEYSEAEEAAEKSAALAAADALKTREEELAAREAAVAAREAELAAAAPKGGDLPKQGGK